MQKHPRSVRKSTQWRGAHPRQHPTSPIDADASKYPSKGRAGLDMEKSCVSVCVVVFVCPRGQATQQNGGMEAKPYETRLSGRNSLGMPQNGAGLARRARNGLNPAPQAQNSPKRRWMVRNGWNPPKSLKNAHNGQGRPTRTTEALLEACNSIHRPGRGVGACRRPVGGLSEVCRRSVGGLSEVCRRSVGGPGAVGGLSEVCRRSVGAKVENCGVEGH